MLFLVVGFGVLYGWRDGSIDVNLFSLGALKAGWLSRRYLGASRPIPAWRRGGRNRAHQRVGTGAPCFADAAGEPALQLREFRPTDRVRRWRRFTDFRALCIGRRSDLDRVYWGPQLFLNTTVTVGAMLQAAPGERESFFLSPLYCGSQSLGYARTENRQHLQRRRPEPVAGPALAISASAGLSECGFESRPAHPLLTLLSSVAAGGSRSPSPTDGPRQSRGSANCRWPRRLACGPPRENSYPCRGGADSIALGVYELIRRRCRYIVAIAAGAGEEGLATLIRRCQIDFGIRIVVGAGPLAPSGTDILSGLQAVVGEVHYDDVDPDATPGSLIYVSLASAAPFHRRTSGTRLLARCSTTIAGLALKPRVSSLARS